MNKKILIISLFVVVLMASFVSAATVNKNQVIEQNGHEIEVLDVSEDGSCIFKVDGELVIIEEHQKETHNGVTIWVKNAYVLHSDEDNACEFILTSGTNKDKATDSYSTLKTITAETTEKLEKGVEKVKDVVEVVKEELDSNQTNKTNTTIIDDINNSPIKQTEKSIIKRFVEWFKGLFGVK
ncbi:hypothetical protein HOC35_00960 [Candidatus Woesearchaeota archaeon]|jgi:hypothetical protein|nr:hypothetical protein [Candidatus Woesearchaeota archaeon]